MKLPKLPNAMLAVLCLTVTSGCATQSEDFPKNSADAFALTVQPAGSTTMIETFLVKGTVGEGLTAAEQALDSVGFRESPKARTQDRRCGEYPLRMHEWPFWACIYLQPREDGALAVRVIVESWVSFGVQTSNPWHIDVASAFQNRIRLKRNLIQ